jgi:hypothetical protein
MKSWQTTSKIQGSAEGYYALSVPPIPALPWNDDELAAVAAAAARRLKAQHSSYGGELDRVIADDIRRIISALLETAESMADDSSLEQYLSTLSTPALRQGFHVQPLLLLLYEVESALGELIESTNGVAALGSVQWRSIQALIRHTVLHFVAELSE